ncbi:MAG: hypothetical protein IAE97_05540 [Chthoniobacterales bacterium]|nr:hypothetical protein [Chthoniobacterales bacterium]
MMKPGTPENEITAKNRRPSWPPIKKARKNGRPCWLVDARLNGKGPRYYCETLEEAKGKAHEANITRKNEGGSAIYNAELSAYGWNVSRAIEFALDHLRKSAKAKPLADAVADFTASKADKSDAYKRDLKGILDALKTALPTATTASVATAEINDFLAALHPVTANNRRRVLAVFFNWCVMQGLRTDNPAESAAVAKVTHGTPGILTPEELAAMLEAAEDCILPAIVLGAFAGLRQAEIARCDWRNVDLAEAVVTLDAGTTKTNSRRAVRLPAAAVAWLAGVAKKSGPVFVAGPEARAAWDLARMAAGFGPFQTSLMRVRQATAALTPKQIKALLPWPDNALRHSAISYRLALRPEAAAAAFNIAPEAVATVTGIEAVAYAAGNSPKIIRAHYDALGKPSAAAAWFRVTPAGAPRNVVPMAKAAAGA